MNRFAAQKMQDKTGMVQAYLKIMQRKSTKSRIIMIEYERSAISQTLVRVHTIVIWVIHEDVMYSHSTEYSHKSNEWCYFIYDRYCGFAKLVFFLVLFPTYGFR